MQSADGLRLSVSMRGVLSRGTPSAAGWNGPRSLPVQGLNCSVLLLMDVRPRID